MISLHRVREHRARPGRKAGLCKRCYVRAQHPVRPCEDCGRTRRQLAAGLCAGCYRRSRTRLVTCTACGEQRPVWFGDRCERCKRRAAAKAGACRDCGKQVSRLWSGRCRSCDSRSRLVTGACRDCGDLTGLESGLCRACPALPLEPPGGHLPLVRPAAAGRRQRGVPLLPARRPGRPAGRPGPAQAVPHAPPAGRASPRRPGPGHHRGVPRLRRPDLAVRRPLQALPGLPRPPSSRGLRLVPAGSSRSAPPGSAAPASSPAWPPASGPGKHPAAGRRAPPPGTPWTATRRPTAGARKRCATSAAP